MTEYKKALDAFLASDDGEKSADPATLRAPSVMRTFLENRLKIAFQAGWRAHEAAQGKEGVRNGE
jgi:hypothetical protein